MADTVNINQPGLPEYEKRRDQETSGGTSGGTSTKTLAPEATSALGQADTAIDQQKQVATAQGDLNVQAAEQDAAIKQQNEAQQQALADEKMQALTGQFSATGEMYQQAKARLKTAQDKMNAMDAPTLFANRDSAGKWRLGISMALAGLGDAMRSSAMVRIGKDPGSASTLKDIVNMDLERQREAIAKAKDSVVMAKTGIADVDAARKALLEEIDLKGATLAAKGASQLRAAMAARGVPQARIDADKTIADLEAYKANKHLDVAGSLTTTIDNHFTKAWKSGSEEINRIPAPDKSGGKPSQGELDKAEKAGQLANEIAIIKANGVVPDKDAAETKQDNESKLSATEKPGVVSGIATLAGRAAGVVPRSASEGIPEKQQKLLNAWDSGAEIVYHQLTGAGMAESESRRLSNNLKYQPGDSPALTKQKLDRLQLLADIGTKLSGPAALERMQSVASAPLETAPSAPRQAAPVPGAPRMTDTQRKQAIEILRKMPKGEKRAAALSRYGISEEELN